MNNPILSAALMAGMASAAAATTIPVDNLSDVGTLALGTTNLTGNVSGECVDDGGMIDCLFSFVTPRDDVLFPIAAGTELTAIALSAEGTAPAGFAMKGVVFDLGRVTGGLFATGALFELNTAPVDGLVRF